MFFQVITFEKVKVTNNESDNTGQVRTLSYICILFGSILNETVFKEPSLEEKESDLSIWAIFKIFNPFRPLNYLINVSNLGFLTISVFEIEL